MNTIPLGDAKRFLDVIHGADDSKLQDLLVGAEDEAMRFMNRIDLTEWDAPPAGRPVPGSVVIGILLLLQAAYQATPDDADKLRKAAEIKLMPYRCGMGV